MNYQEMPDQNVVMPQSPMMDDMNTIDKTKVFWTVVLAVFVVSFVFILGYWVGEQKAATDYFRVMPSGNVDVTPLATDSSINSVVPNRPQDTYTSQPTAPTGVNPNDNLDALDNAVSDGNNGSIAVAAPPITNNNPVPPVEKSITLPTPPIVKSLTIVKNEKNINSRKSIASTPGNYAVRLATVRSKANAEALVSKLKSMGYGNVNMLKIGVLYRISALGFADANEAKNFQKKAKTQLKLSDTLVIKLK